MQRRRFGRTGLEVPALTFGGGWVGGLLIRGSEQERDAVLDRALHAGIDWIDTAALYGNGVSETVIGGWLRGVAKEKRPRISTKFNIDTSAGDFAGQIERSVTASLQRLGLPSVPLLILHSRVVEAANKGRDKRSLTVQEVLGPGGIADIMDKLRAQGLCDWIGLTGLGDPASVAPGDRQRPLRCGPDLLQPAQSDRDGKCRPRLELHRLRRPPAPVRGPGHGRHGHPHFGGRAPRLERAPRPRGRHHGECRGRGGRSARQSRPGRARVNSMERAPRPRCDLASPVRCSPLLWSGSGSQGISKKR